jgi:hypothetical protein
MDLSALRKIGFGDMRLWGIRWESDGRDVVLAVELGNGTRAELRCTWATNVRIDVAKGQKGGPAMTWEGSILKCTDGTNDVSFDFAGDGKLSLKCNEVFAVAGS